MDSQMNMTSQCKSGAKKASIFGYIIRGYGKKQEVYSTLELNTGEIEIQYSITGIPNSRRMLKIGMVTGKNHRMTKRLENVTCSKIFQKHSMHSVSIKGFKY